MTKLWWGNRHFIEHGKYPKPSGFNLLHKFKHRFPKYFSLRILRISRRWKKNILNSFYRSLSHSDWTDRVSPIQWQSTEFSRFFPVKLNSRFFNGFIVFFAEVATLFWNWFNENRANKPSFFKRQYLGNYWNDLNF